jgi:hypothetical protein
MKLQIHSRNVPVNFAAISALKITIFRQLHRASVHRTTIMFASIYKSNGALARWSFAAHYPKSVFHAINLLSVSREVNGLA